MLDSFPLCIKFKSHKLMFRSIKWSVNRNQHSFHVFAFVTTWISYNDVKKKSQRLTSTQTHSWADTPKNLTSFSDELAERSTSWASKNSETDSDMERRLSFATCCDRGRLTWICSPGYRREKHMVQSLLVQRIAICSN